MLNVPDTLDVDEIELAMLVATRLYEQGKLSLGQAAEVAGLTKRTFAELLGRYNVSIFNYPSEEFVFIVVIPIVTIFDGTLLIIATPKSITFLVA